MATGIDVSHHQGTINWGLVKEEVDFAIIRGGYGQNNLDKQAHINLLRCNELDIPCGMYWFSYAYTVPMAHREAEFAVRLARQHKLEYPIYFDFEYDSMNYAKKNGVNVDDFVFNRMCREFCDTVEDAGYYAGIYVNQEYYKKLDKETVRQYDLWIARYSAKRPKQACGMWQSTDKGTVAGIRGGVDMDTAFYDFPGIMHKKGLNNLGKEDD